jgi:hypothetical protein
MILIDLLETALEIGWITWKTVLERRADEEGKERGGGAGRVRARKVTVPSPTARTGEWGAAPVRCFFD